MTAKTGINSTEATLPGGLDADSAKGANEGSADAGNMLDGNAVAAWLQSNPRFFQEHPEHLLDLNIPHHSGKAISLLERQVAAYRKRQQDTEEHFNEIIGNARENDLLFEITRMVILDLLHCSSLPDLNTAIEDKLKTDFDASAAHLVFVAEHDFPQENGMRCLPSTAVRAALGELYQKQRTWCGPLNKVQGELLFRDASATIVSAAIVPLHLPEASPIRDGFGLPLLLVGSTEEAHFNSSLDTLFLDFIGEVLAIHLHNLAGKA